MLKEVLLAGQSYQTTFETIAVRVGEDAARSSATILPRGTHCLLVGSDGPDGRLVQVEIDGQQFLIPAAALLPRRRNARRMPVHRVPPPASLRRSG